MTFTYSATPTGNGWIRSDGAFVPFAATNKDYQAYLAWVADGNSAAPAAEPTLSDAQDTSKKYLEREADRRRRLAFNGTSDLVWWRELVLEAQAADVDGSIGDTEYPLLLAEIPVRGASVAEVATNVLAEYASVKGSWAAINAARTSASNAVDNAADVADVQAAEDAVVWP
jgi:hypothetical protein